jgi:glutamate synthase (NADPH/NADH)
LLCTRRDVSEALLPVESATDVRQLKAILQQHLKMTGSAVARKWVCRLSELSLHFQQV